MLPNAVRVLLGGILLILSVGHCPAQADSDMVKEKLFKAKQEYDREVQAFRKAISDLFDKQEDIARGRGDKKAVDQIKAGRAAFENTGQPPAEYPAALQTQMASARASLDAAYTEAIKGYLRLKDDNAAETTEKEQKQFQLSSVLQFGKRTYLVSLRHYDVRVSENPFTNNGTHPDTGTKLKMNGHEAPHSIFLHPATKNSSQVRYQLNGRWKALRVSVGVPKIEAKAEQPATPLTFEILGDGKSLWKSEPVTKMDTYQTCEISVAKVKVLTLTVHCPGQNSYARSVWFEPFLAE